MSEHEISLLAMKPGSEWREKLEKIQKDNEELIRAFGQREACNLLLRRAQI